jgi:hypothetical protein
MVTRDFSGYDVAKVLANKGNFRWVNTQGDHAILKWNILTGQMSKGGR